MTVLVKTAALFLLSIPPVLAGCAANAEDTEAPATAVEEISSQSAPARDAVPCDGPPVYTAPSYSAPVYKAPVYTAPTYSAPVYIAPVYTVPPGWTVVGNGPQPGKVGS